MLRRVWSCLCLCTEIAVCKFVHGLARNLFCPLYMFIHFLYSTFHLRSCTIEMSIIIISFYAVVVKKGGIVELYSIYSTVHSICAVKETGYMDVSIPVTVLLCCGGCVGVTYCGGFGVSVLYLV